MNGEQLLLDVTRLVSRAWTRRHSTGIDRVCEAYCRQFRSRARAVVQHKGIIRILEKNVSADLFELLLEPGTKSRSQILRFVPATLRRSPSRFDARGQLYINTSHTDFDLDQHHSWAASTGLRTVYFLHDLIPLKHPRLSTAHGVIRHRGRIRGAIRNGSGAIVNTHATARELRSFAEKRGLTLPPVIVAPLAGADLGRKSAISSHLAARGSNASVGDQAPHFVCVGTIERRKNYDMLLRIWSRMADRFGSDCPQLIVFGQLGPQSEPILRTYRSDPKLAKLIRFATKASDAEIAATLRNARALLMPTHAEGYGLPVIEAMQFGAPVIASDIPSFREIGQGVPELVGPSEEREWEAIITRFAFSNEERDQQLARLEGFVAPTWREHFSIIEPWLERLESDREAAPLREEVLC